MCEDLNSIINSGDVASLYNEKDIEEISKKKKLFIFAYFFSHSKITFYILSLSV